jgi:HipA-like protein
MQLIVWMNGQRVGAWDQTRRGRDTFRYDPAWGVLQSRHRDE